jgi:TolB-like protein/DNA-binding winged helix-turn-helix (wHTH) protein/tetratricopeptide (TPR) repeat protein
LNPSENGVGERQSAVYEFDGFVLDRHELRRPDGSVIALTSRLFETLEYFVQHHDRILDKEQIMEAVWPGSTVEENNLAQAVSKLRHLFGEKPGAKQFIVTVPGRGYRFIAPVRNIESTEPRAPRLYSTSEALLRLTFGQSLQAHRRSLSFAAALLLAALVAFFWWQPSDKSGAESGGEPIAVTEKTIAILPFDNFQSDKADAFFADGIQDDILTSLGKIKDIKVIARPSTADYRGPRSAAKLREIARALGASHVLEGSVRRIADRVVISVALIDTRSQRQVWSERYDRTLSDTLSLQGELAVEIVRELRGNLTALENTSIAIKPTQIPDAYVLYLRGRDAETGAQKSLSHLDALQFYRQAVERDSNFALARARLSICASYLFSDRRDTKWKTQARVEAEEALRLQPQLGEAHLALALCHLCGDNDDDLALDELNRTAELLPNSAEVPLVTAFIHKRHNRFGERVAALARAESLDPRNRMILAHTHLTHCWMRNWPEAVRALDRRRLAWPEENYPQYSPEWDRARDQFCLTADISILDRALAGASSHATDRPLWLRFAIYSTAMLKRDYATAAESLATLSQKDLEEFDNTSLLSFELAFLLAARDPGAIATREAFIAARDECELRLAATPVPAAGLTALNPGGTYEAAKMRATLALIYAYLGERERATAIANQAVEFFPTPPGSVEQNHIRATLALVYTQIGETEKALHLVETLLKLPSDFPPAPYNLTIANLKYSWQWDPLRGDPRFQKLIARREGSQGP